MPNEFYSQSNHVAYFTAFRQIKFESVSGGEVEIEKSQVYPGGSNTQKNVAGGRVSISSITLEKSYEPNKDAPLEAWATAYANGTEEDLTLVIQPTTPEGIAKGKADRYEGCALTSLSKPDPDSSSSDASTLGITVQPERKE